MRGGHDSVAGVRSRATGGADWPTGADAWVAYAATVAAEFPLVATDWDLHAEYVDAGVYSVRERSFSAWPAAAPVHVFADEPPLSPEEEEAYAAAAGGPAQMELF